MFSAIRTSSRRQQLACWSARLVLAVSVLLAVGGIAAQPGLAAGAPFQRGDVFLTGSGSVQEYSPTGQLLETLTGTSGAGSLCFNPNGRRLVVPGVGLFDSSGNPLPSSWTSVTNADRCVADGLGDVYVSPSFGWTVTKYHIDGEPVQTYNLAILPGGVAAFSGMDLGPDECTLYYGDWAGPDGAIGRFNACTNVQKATFTDEFSPTDDLRVLPDWEVIRVDDPRAALLDTSGQIVRSYIPNDPFVSNTLRSVSLDPDGTSFWVSTFGVFYVSRFDISSGQQLSEWPGGGPIAVYSPPLLGDANVGNTLDSDSPGTAEAFPARVGYSGQLSRLHLWVDSSSTASKVVVGVYSNHNGQPGALQEQATITNPTAGSWNYVDVPSMSVTAGHRSWIAVLGPKGGGTIRLRDASSGGTSYTSAQHNLTALPATWSSGRAWASAPLSGYGS